MLEELDAGLIEQFERFSNWWQRLTGYTCFWLTRVCIYLCWANLAMTVFAATFWNEEVDVFYKMLMCVLLLGGGSWVVASYILERQFEEQKEACVNPFRGYRSERSMLVLVSLLLCGSALISHRAHEFFLLDAIFSTICAMYFIGCNPLPPGESKIRQWLNNLRESLSATLMPVPQPKLVPVRLRRTSCFSS